MIKLRRLLPNEWDAIAELIHFSTNFWYEKHLNHGIFAGPTADARVFPEVYEAMDPGQCIVAVDEASGRLAGSCFVHPRETHFSLGIMNVHPDFAGNGVARMILDEIVQLADAADAAGLPVRLVSSALNLDSYSLYTRAGFVPRALFQDMVASRPMAGETPPGTDRIRPATLADVPAIADLEMELAHIRRERDYAHFVENAAGIWRLSVIESAERPKMICGFLASVNHPGSNLLGPGVMRSDADALALICAEIEHFQKLGNSPVFLVPADRPQLVQELYRRGARNCELHVCQVRGHFTPFSGIVMPTFMPETG
ncbi:MAG: GNAT superfamily N-acetyltransferase [Verrucomicrobiales bacterium]|jgi:GNAT superfamily N-acetyltransferase